jgi:Sulfatase
MNRRLLDSMVSIVFATVGMATAAAQTTPDRTVLPIPGLRYPHSTVIDTRNATPPPRFEVKAPHGAPNVLFMLLDDFGFGQSSAFGGPIDMPTLDRLATNWLRYNQFHTAAMARRPGWTF